MAASCSTMIENSGSVKLPLINRSLLQPVWYQNIAPSIADQLSEHRSKYTRHLIPKSSSSTSSFDNNNGTRPFQLSQIPFDYATENRENYSKSFVNSRNGFMQHLRRRDQIRLSQEPMSSISNYKDEFVTKKRESFQSAKPSESQIQFIFESPTTKNSSDQPIQEHFQSLYRNDFGKTPAVITEAPKKSVKFQVNNDTAATDYSANFLEKSPTRVYLAPPAYKTPKQPLVCNTSYSDNYVQHAYSKQNMIAPKTSHLNLSEDANTATISSSTTYNNDFIRRPRDNSLDRLNIYQYSGSLIHKVKPELLNETNSEPFHDYGSHIFLKANQNHQYKN